MGRAAWFLLLVAAVAGADQLVKWRIFSYLQDREPPSLVVIPNILSLTAVHQTGAAFGMFRGHNLVLAIVSALAFVILGALTYWATRRITVAAFGIIAGGAVGNLIDRIMLHEIRDFIDLHIWPVFNLADVAICAGAAILVVEMFREKLGSTESR